MEVNNVVPNSQAPTANSTPVQTSTPQPARREPAPVTRDAQVNAPPPPSSVPMPREVEAEIYSRPITVESVSDETLDRVIAEANQSLAASNRRLERGVHEATNLIMVRVLDNDTNEVIRELPPESRLDVMAKIVEMAGISVDDWV